MRFAAGAGAGAGAWAWAWAWAGAGAGAGDDSTRGRRDTEKAGEPAQRGARGSRYAVRTTAGAAGEAPSDLGSIIRLTLLMEVIRTHWRLKLNRNCQMAMIYEHKFDLPCSPGPIQSLPVG